MSPCAAASLENPTISHTAEEHRRKQNDFFLATNCSSQPYLGRGLTGQEWFINGSVRVEIRVGKKKVKAGLGVHLSRDARELLLAAD